MIKAIKKLIEEEPYYVTMVEMEAADRKFMILGQTQVFFVENSLRRYADNTDDFKYSEIKRLKYWKNREDFVVIKFKSTRSNKGNDEERKYEEKVRDDMKIICEDARNLINSLKCYW